MCIPLDPTTGKQIYIFTFNIARIENQKNLSLENALAFWDLLLGQKFKHMELWKEFLTVFCCLQLQASLIKIAFSL